MNESIRNENAKTEPSLKEFPRVEPHLYDRLRIAVFDLVSAKAIFKQCLGGPYGPVVYCIKESPAEGVQVRVACSLEDAEEWYGGE